MRCTSKELAVGLFLLYNNRKIRVKCNVQVKCYVPTQAKEKYKKVLDELNSCTQPYIESMEQVFDQCQQFEEKRLRFIREVLLDVKHHLNLTEDQRSGSGRQYKTPHRRIGRAAR